jgi:hypothetical protein
VARLIVIRRLVPMGVLVLAVASGCTQTENGQPSPSAGQETTSGQAATSAQPSTGTAPLAPPVSDQRDARGTTACAAVQPAQLQELGLDPARQRELSLPRPFQKGCAWTSTDSAWSVGFGFDTSTKGLSTLYEARANYGYFEPREIDGRPAVDAQTALNPEDCYTYVGVADTQTLYINVDNSPLLAGEPLKPACERVDEIVKMVIGNLPPLK